MLVVGLGDETQARETLEGIIQQARSGRALQAISEEALCWIYLCPFAAVGAQRLDMGAPGRGAYPGWQFGGLSTSTGVGLF